MNHCKLQQNVFVPHEERRGLVSFCNLKNPVVCPNPRRVFVTQAAEVCDSRASAELLDIIVRKDYGIDLSITPVASSPPFFHGSPPSRASNPLVQDACFGNEKLTPLSPLPFVPSPSSGCVRKKFGLKPAQVRVEGFNCLNGNRQNSSIPAMA